MSAEDEHARIDAEIVRSGRSNDPFASAVRATRMPMLITDPNLPDNPIVFANDAFLAFTGYERAEVIGRNCRFLQGDATNAADIARIREAVRQREPIEIDIVNYKKAGERFWNRLLLAPVFDEDNTLTYFFASQLDVTAERDHLERISADRDALEREVEARHLELIRSEERLRFIVQAARLGTWTLDLQTGRLVVSHAFKQILGLRAGLPLTREHLVAAVHPHDRDKALAAMDVSSSEQKDHDTEFRVVTPSGETRWVLMRGRSHLDAEDRPLGIAGVVLDVTDRRRHEEHRLLLTAELEHRVKNSMATMQSIATQTLRGARSVEEAAATLGGRLQALAAAHDLATRELWSSATLAEIAAAALRPFRDEEDRIGVSGPEVAVPPRATMALILALHELASNAVRYGALSDSVGSVELAWEIVQAAGDRRLRLRWEEKDGPIVEAPARRGFGSMLIEPLLGAELEGQAKLDFKPRGLVFTLEAPLPETGGDADEHGMPRFRRPFLRDTA